MNVPDFYRVLWRRKLLILALTAAMGAGVYVLVKREAPTYTASTVVRIQQRIANAGDAFGALQTGGRLAQTYAVIVGTSTIADTIGKKLGDVPRAQIYGHVSGTQLQDLDLLRIDATAPTPRQAQRIADAAPGALRRFIKETATYGDHVITVQPAAEPLAPSSPRLKLDLMLAILVGLVFNSGLAIALEALGDRIHDASALESLTLRPVIAVIPKVALSKSSKLAIPLSTLYNDDLPEER